MAVMVVAGLGVLVAPAEGEQAVDLPPGVDPDPTSIGLLSGHGEQVLSGAVATGVVCFLLSLVVVVVRYRRSRGLMRDRMRWLLWSVVVIAVTLATGSVVEVPGFEIVYTFVVIVLPTAAMTVAIVRPQVLPIQDLLARTVVLAALVLVLLAADVGVLALLTLVLDDDLTQAQVVTVVLLVAVLLYGPLRQRLSAAARRWMLGGRSNPLRRPRGPVVDAGEHRRPGRSSSPRWPAPSPPRSACGSSASRSTGPAATAPSRRTATGPARFARCRSPTGARTWVVSCSRRAACAAG
ncbi:hypothetical protein [Nocardioides sp. TF02-7]|uniref:hypothetical protein n=1 Tax=Nocardioides sp. TF02-7 TaxID=2917724 RepID=UPI001F05213B|nr:hypothetical protein [Nocardioides sp. TF02-7]UMG93505.1 hypothetical protein MF408_04640 [Nocardioides sp. TF02-7]